MRTSQVKLGAILSYVSLALSTIISIIYTPIMITRLGESEYGVYNIVLPIISYLNLLNFGLGSAYVRYYSRYKVEDDQENMHKLNGMFLLTYSVLGALVFIIGFYLSYNGTVIFGQKLTAQEVSLGCRLLRIMTINAALNFPLMVFDANIMIHERYLFQKVVAMGKLVLNPLVMIPLLLMGYRSTTLTVVALIFTILTGIINIFYCVRILDMRFTFKGYDFSLLKEMFGFTAFVFLGIVVDEINWSIDRLMLGWFHGTTAVTIYVVASQLNIYYLSMSNTLSNVLTPRVHRMVAQNRPMYELDAIFQRAGRLQFILLACIYLGFLAVGKRFVVLWAGGQQFTASYYMALILFSATIFPAIQTLGIEIQKAKNMHKFRSVVYACVALGNAALTIPLCIRWQGLGASIATTTSTLVGNVILMNWYYHNRIGLDIKGFWRSIASLLPSMVIPTALAIAISLFINIRGYFMIALFGLIIVAVYGACLWLFGMNPYEKELVRKPTMKILGLFNKQKGNTI